MTVAVLSGAQISKCTVEQKVCSRQQRATLQTGAVDQIATPGTVKLEVLKSKGLAVWGKAKGKKLGSLPYDIQETPFLDIEICPF